MQNKTGTWWNWSWVLAVGCASLLADWPGAAQSTETAGKPTLYYVPHTHWEAAVFKTREEYLQMGLPHILQALRLLKEYPDYKFTLDQVAYFKPFLERYPEEAEAFRQFVREGRLEIVGGMDVMPDVVKPGGELFVRQMLYGQGFCREHLGVKVSVAWLLDTFGSHAQMPQLLRQAGFESFWFCRGVPNKDMPSEFLWEGIDGTRIPTFWLPGFYGLFYGPPKKLPQFTEFFERRFEQLTPHARGLERVGLAGVDVSEPEDFVPSLIAEFNRQPDAPFIIRTAVPSDFARVVNRRTDRPVLTNDFNPIFQGTYSSRVELKQITRALEGLLLQAENLAALAQWLKAPAHQDLVEKAWEPVLFNQTHDLASGVMTDHVYEDTLRSYNYSKDLAADVIQSDWDTLAAQIDTRGNGIPVVVFNPLGWSRTDAAEIEVGFAQAGVQDVALVDSTGTAHPVQIMQAQRDAKGDLQHARLAFLAKAVPALGYATYHVLPLSASGKPDTATREDKESSSMENEYYLTSFNSTNGALTSLFDKSLQWEALAGPANVVTREVDKGDLWELYRGLDGGSYIAMTNQQAVPKRSPGPADKTKPELQALSSEFSGEPGTIRRGQVYSEFSCAHSMAGSGFATRVRLYHGVRRVDFQTELVNHEKWVRYQALFPTAVARGQTAFSIPFGALERPSGIEFPAQHWIDHSDGARGVALLNFGLPGHTVSDGTMMLSLLRAHNLGAYGFGGGYEPGMSSETGFQLGKPLTFQYALVPHAGDWREAGIYRAGLEFNQPLLVRKTAVHNGVLPPNWGMLTVSQPNIVLTAFKPGSEGSTVLRFYEAAGRDTPQVTIQLHAQTTAAHEANLLEEAGRALPLQGSNLQMAFHPFEIKTLKMQLSRE